MRYRFCNPVQGIVDYDSNRNMEYNVYLDECCIEDSEKKDFDYLTGENTTVYEEYISRVVEKDLREELNEGTGLMQYFDYGSKESYKESLEKVKSAYPRTETIRSRAYGVMVYDIQKPFNEREIEILKDYFAEQYSDGRGEGFAQRGIETLCGILCLNLYSDDFCTETEDELENSLESKQNNEIQFGM